MNAKNSLSLQFAGTKKLRMLEASKRREINEVRYVSELVESMFRKYSKYITDGAP